MEILHRSAIEIRDGSKPLRRFASKRRKVGQLVEWGGRGAEMSRYPLFDRSRLELRRLAERGHDMKVEQLLPLAPPQSSFSHPEFAELMRAIAGARQADRPVIVMMGGHPIKLGLSRFLIDLIERRLVTHLATNGAGIIHDFELAMAGGTSEDVAKWIQVA